jgi:hypothetical protein
MKILIATVSAIALAAIVNVSPAAAAQYGPPTATSGNPHYEWQYHYVGHHPHYQGDWVLVR